MCVCKVGRQVLDKVGQVMREWIILKRGVPRYVGVKGGGVQISERHHDSLQHDNTTAWQDGGKLGHEREEIPKFLP